MCIEKKSLAIYCFFDKEGIVDEYVCFALSEIKNVCQKLIVVVNGNITDEGYKKMQRYTEDIVVRDNEGMDAGAYKSVLMALSESMELLEYDELVLMNDTFFGPFVSFSNIFSKMRQQDVDYWGLNYIDHKLIDYIQSYFLVFEKKLIQSGDIVKYFKDSIDEHTKNWNSVCAFFEVGLHQYLKSKGYAYSTYTFAGNGNLYKTSKTSIQKYHLPILKKKSFLMDENVWDAVSWIEKNTEYNIGLILENIKRIYGIGKSTTASVEYSQNRKDEFIEVPMIKLTNDMMKFFVESNEEIYIYGTGYWAQIIFVLFFRNESKMKGFVVSEDKNTDESLFGFPIIPYNKFNKKVGIILGLNQDNTQEVVGSIHKTTNILKLW